MTRPPRGARTSPATARNRRPILDVLASRLPSPARVLEVASGAGEHAVWLAKAMPEVQWRPSEVDPAAMGSIAAWRAAEALPNLLSPIWLDVADPKTWPHERYEAVVCINMIHISPWAATEGLMALAGRVLDTGGLLYLYGPFLEDEVETVTSNLAFDADLRGRNPAWGLRRKEDVAALAARHGLELAERIPMPANNLSLIFRRT